MKILIACEESGVVRTAFERAGFDAWSCDLLPSRIPSKKHLQGDVREILDGNWAAIIAHPPCTFLTVTANKWMKPEFRSRFPDRPKQREDAVTFFMLFVDCDCEKVAIENPVGIMSTRYRVPDQYIQPYQFGHAETKKTGLWLRGLPPLKPTKIVEPVFWTAAGKKYSPSHYGSKASLRSRNRLDYLKPGAERSKFRSETYKGIAQAMADQWGPLL